MYFCYIAFKFYTEGRRFKKERLERKEVNVQMGQRRP